MRKGSKARFVNGIISALIVVFFAVHGILGSLAGLIGFKSSFSFLAWAGVAFVAMHVMACIVTSYQQLTDTVRPPSVQKKRHLVLKWITGIPLACTVAIHIVSIRLYGAGFVFTAQGAVLTIVLALLLAWHMCVGAKSLLKDLNIDRKYRTVFRVCACCLAAFFCLAALLNIISR